MNCYSWPGLSLVLESRFNDVGTAFSNDKKNLVELTGFTCLLLFSSCFSVFFLDKEINHLWTVIFVPSKTQAGRTWIPQHWRPLQSHPARPTTWRPSYFWYTMRIQLDIVPIVLLTQTPRFSQYTDRKTTSKLKTLQVPFSPSASRMNNSCAFRIGCSEAQLKCFTNRYIFLMLRELFPRESHAKLNFQNACNFFLLWDAVPAMVHWLGMLRQDEVWSTSLTHLLHFKGVLYTPVTICGSPLYIKDFRWHFYIFQVMQIISDVSCISKLAFLSAVQISLTELLLSGSQKQLTLLRFWASIINCIQAILQELNAVSNGKHIHTYQWHIF